MTNPYSKVSSLFFLLLLLIMLSPSNTGVLLAAEETKPPVESGTSGGQSVDKLLLTLNESLKENRKMRQEMQDLRASSEKLMTERNDIAKQAQQIVQQAVSQKDREMDRKMADMNGQVEAARKEVEALKKANGEATAGREELEKKLEEMNKANEEMKKLLAAPLAGPAQKTDMNLAKKNEEGIARAIGLVSGLNVENVELKERLVGAHFDLGNIYYDLGRYQEAIAQYELALRLNPLLVWAHHNLAIIYDYRMGDMKRAKYHYQQYMNLKPATENGEEVKMRLWEVEQLCRLEPDEPLKKDFQETQKY